MLKKSFLALSADDKAKAKKDGRAPKSVLTDTVDPLKPIVSKKKIDEAPKASPETKTAPRSAHHATEDTPKTPAKPKKTERRKSPREQMQDAQPKQSHIGLGDILNTSVDDIVPVSHAASVGLGTGLEVVKAIPRSLQAPHITYGGGSVGAGDSPIEHVKPTVWSDAVGSPEEPKLKYPDLFGGRTNTPLKDQIAAVKKAKLTPAQTRTLAMGISQLPKLERTNVLAGIPDIQVYHLFDGAPKERKAFLDSHPDLPDNASDRQIIEALGQLEDKKPKGWNKLNPFNSGYSPADVIGAVGEGYIHPAFRTFVETPAKIGAGILGGSFAVGKSAGTGDPKYAKEALAEGLVGAKGAGHGLLDLTTAHGFKKSLQDDPIGTAVTVATLGDTAAGKIASSRTLRGANADRWVNQERNLQIEDLGKAHPDQLTTHTVSKGPKSKKPITRWLQDRYDEGQSSGIIPGADKVMAKAVLRDRAAAEGHAHADVAPLFDASHDAARRHRITVQRQTEILHTHGEGVTHGQMESFYRTQHDHITEVLKQDDKLRKQREAEAEGADKPQSQGELNDLADHYEEQGRVARADAEAARERLSRQDAKTSGLFKAGGRADSVKKLERQIAQHEKDATSWEKQAKDTRALAKEAPLPRKLLTKTERRNLKRVQKNVGSHRDWHTGKSDAPLTAGEQEWLDTMRAAAQHRTDIVREHGLSDESIMYRDNETPINVAAHDGEHPLHAAATAILDLREQLRTLHRENPKLSEGIAPEDVLALADEIKLDLNDILHGFIEHHGGNAFRNPHEIPRTRNTFRGRGNRLSPRSDFPTMAGKMGGSSGLQLRSGHYAHSVEPLLRGVAQASRADANVNWVQSVLGDKNHGVVRVPEVHPGQEVRAGDLVQDPTQFVERSPQNLRRAIDSRSNIDSAIEETVNPPARTRGEKVKGVFKDNAPETDLEKAYEESLVNPNLQHDSTVTPGNVLVPKAVDEALVGGLTHRHTPDALNTIYRANVLYSRPGFAFRNLTQALTTNALEGVGPLSYWRAARNKLPVSPGVENRGLAGQAARGDFEESHAITNILRDIPLGDRSVSVGGLAKATVKITPQTIRVLTDTTRKLNREFENFARRAAWYKLSVKEAKHTLGSSTAGFQGMFERTALKMKGVTDEVHTYLEEIADPRLTNDPALQRIAQRKADVLLDKIHAIQGDYLNMKDLPRVALFVPFYRWYLFIGGLMLKMPFTHPVGNQFAQGLGQIGDQVRKNLDQDINDGNRNDTNIPLPGLTSTLSKATTLNAEYLNPGTSISDAVNHPESLAPLYDMVSSIVKGKDAYGNDLVDQWGLPLDTKGKIENAAGTALNLFAPAKVTDSILHPGPRSANSLPVISSKPRHQSLKQIREGADIESRKPTDTPLESIFNWLTSAGLHEKNLTGQAEDDAKRKLDDMRKRQTAELAAKRLGKK